MTSDSAPFRPCAIVPSHNHWRSIGSIIARLVKEGLPVFLIDDGSDVKAQEEFASLAQARPEVTVHRFDANQGKGCAVIQGFRMAIERGYTHAVQIDADGQHDIEALSDMLNLARQHPDAIVTGHAVFDHSVPLGRAIGRWITHFWVWIETLSFRIPDTMCGFRLYPLSAVDDLLSRRIGLGARMDFDTEIAVRLFWQGTPIVSIPVKVTYPEGNSSNFRLVEDNVRISAMHTRLVFTMLFNFRSILSHRPRAIETSQHWPWLAERGLYLGLLFLAAAYRCIGRRLCIAVMAPIVFYFYLTGGEQRRASRKFLERAFAARSLQRVPGFWMGYRHFLSFAIKSLDTFIGWTRPGFKSQLLITEPEILRDLESDPRGAIIIVSHVGNVDLTRAALDGATRKRLIALVHTRHAENYNRIIKRLNPEAATELMQVSELGPESAIALQERVERGQWIAIAGDRTPVSGGIHTSRVPFLGFLAPFSNGPYILAAILGCPVYTLFCMKIGHRHRLDVRKLADRIELPRRDRAGALKAYAERFSTILESYAVEDPLQWYNFYDFWSGYNEAPPL